MASRNHLLRLPMPTPRQPLHRRSDSSSSDASHASNISHHSHGSEDQFVLSPAQTPANENASPRGVMVPGYATDSSAPKNGLLLGKEVHTRPQDSESIAKAPSFLRIAPNSQSRPIAIEPPAGRGADSISASASIPLEPLSARGDLPGGYFPLHEDPESRLRIPHPFHLDADMARQSSRQRAAESSKGSAHPPLSSPTGASTSPDTPISSYIPSGFHEDVVLPMGKYYPSNWEKRHGKGPINRPPATSQPAAAIRSDSQVPKYYGDQAHPRPGSDVKRRLQQYQRDMVAQAAMAANALIASSGSARSAAASSLGGVPLPKAQLAANFLKTHKPLSPRLRPLGSPGGPVTPMSLEGDCYLSVGSSAAGKDAELPTYEHWDPPQPGNGKQRRADSCASPVELSVASV